MTQIMKQYRFSNLSKFQEREIETRMDRGATQKRKCSIEIKWQIWLANKTWKDVKVTIMETMRKVQEGKVP